MSAKNELIGAEVLQLRELVAVQDGAVVSRTLLKRAGGTVTVFAFDEGQALSEHTTAFEALVLVIEGEVEIAIARTTVVAREGEVVLLPANEPHAVKALKRLKMTLTMIRP